jgi:hypothetical protein
VKKIFGSVLFLFIVSFIHAQDEKWQGVYIFSFTRYVQWPEDYNQGDFVITILGDSPMVQELQNLAEKKKVDGRTIKVTKVAKVNEVKKCHILFIPENQSTQLSAALALIKSNEWASLVVTAQEGLGKKGSCINFVNREGKPSFELNLNAITKHQLKVFTELTRHAIMI